MKYLFAGLVAGSIALAPTAAADVNPDDLNNVEVMGTQQVDQEFKRFDTGIEYVPSSGGQGPFDRTLGLFDDGLSDSSRGMLP